MNAVVMKLGLTGAICMTRAGFLLPLSLGELAYSVPGQVQLSRNSDALQQLGCPDSEPFASGFPGWTQAREQLQAFLARLCLELEAGALPHL